MELAARHRETFWQLVRYGINGGLVTALYALVYWLLVRHDGVRPQVGNLAGYLVAVAAGYLLHSRVTFRGHGERDRATQARFATASILSYAVNAAWVWLFTERLRLPPEAPLLLISFATPVLLFAVNRWWVFR